VQKIAKFLLSYRVIVVGFTLLGLVSRFYNISNGGFVLWDEAHFGKFGTHYIDGNFYFDVHPPLGKMLVGLAGKISGYDGGWGFQSGTEYPPEIPYVKMRMVIATFGALCVPFSYVLAKNLGLSDPVSVLIALTTLLEVGLIGITRLILLDSMLLFFGMATMTFYTAFRRYDSTPFCFRWHWNLLLTGAAIGCVSSVKWVGFFTMAMVGVLTIEELWRMFGKWSMSTKTIAKHFAFRALYLIFVPVVIYVICFFAHFKLLFRSGPGNANMNSLFQASLEGVNFGKSPLEVAYGSRVTLRNSKYSSGLLHSHPHNYPKGSKQQQITTYLHEDDNNNWIVHRTYETSGSSDPHDPFFEQDDYVPQLLKDGDIVRMYHESTKRYLHSHTIPSPLSAGEFEVSAYGSVEHQDPNDLWIVEVAKENYKKSDGNKDSIRSLYTSIRLKHKITGCYLKTSSKQLPDWGFSQGEVTCKPGIKEGSKALKYSEFLWNIEHHTNSKLPPAELGIYKSNFFHDFIEHNIGMWRTNNALVPDPELELGQLASYPYQWFFLTKGSRMSGWDEKKPRFLMLGNPIIWWASSVAILTLLLIWVGSFVAGQRGINIGTTEYWDQFSYRFNIAVGSWFFNYFPYFLMGRITYLHHYYPCLMHAIVAIGVAIEALAYRIENPQKRQRVLYSAVVGLLALFAMGFWHFAPIAYGMDGDPEHWLATRKWLPGWNF